MAIKKFLLIYANIYGKTDKRGNIAYCWAVCEVFCESINKSIAIRKTESHGRPC